MSELATEARQLTALQLKRLQTLYSQFAKGPAPTPDRGTEFAFGATEAAPLANSEKRKAKSDPRAERLLWAGLVANRAIVSFSELTADEAKLCIERLQSALNERQPAVKRSRRRRKTMRTKIADRATARRHAMDGRHDGAEFRDEPQLAGRYDLDVIEGYVTRLGWTREQFEGWLRSARSPLRKKQVAGCQLSVGSSEIRTVAEANRVRWALVRMLKQHGLWAEKKAS